MKLSIAEKFKSLLNTIKNWFKGNTGTVTDPVVTPEDPVTEPVISSSDEIQFSELIWSYGGFKGGGAVLNPDAVIEGLTFSNNKLYYKWTKGGCENFGATGKHDPSYTICAVFFKNTDGKYVGGKFDWISTDRLYRGLEHCTNYNGWTLADVPSTAEAAFVIVGTSSPGGAGSSGKRTNVIKGTWKR